MITNKYKSSSTQVQLDLYKLSKMSYIIKKVKYFKLVIVKDEVKNQVLTNHTCRFTNLYYCFFLLSLK